MKASRDWFFGSRDFPGSAVQNFSVCDGGETGERGGRSYRPCSVAMVLCGCRDVCVLFCVFSWSSLLFPIFPCISPRRLWIDMWLAVCHDVCVCVAPPRCVVLACWLPVGGRSRRGAVHFALASPCGQLAEVLNWPRVTVAGKSCGGNAGHSAQGFCLRRPV